MNPLNKIHSFWFPMMETLLYQEPLKTLKDTILPNTSFQPSPENIFNVFSMSVKDIKVVILGQDPYPTPGDAIGYSFATIEKRKIPKSLQIIKSEIINEGLDSEFSNQENWKTLEHWRESGVFLLNTALTVQTGNAGSHLKYWDTFTRQIIQFISKENPCIWILWGKKAQGFAKNIHNPQQLVKGYTRQTIEQIPINDDYNYVMTSPHPAAEAYAGGKAGFYGCDHFYFVNKILEQFKVSPINW